MRHINACYVNFISNLLRFKNMADFQGYLILFLISLVSVIVVRAILKKFTTSVRLPPSPMALPIIGHLHLLSPLPHQALHKLSLRHGPLMHLYFGSVSCVVASSAEMAKEFLKTQEFCFLDRPKMAAVDFLTYGSADFSFAPYGPYWKFMKKICMSELLSGRTLDLLRPMRQEETIRFIQLMLEKAKSGQTVDVSAQLIRLTNSGVSRMMMSQRCSDNEDDDDQVRKLVKETAELTGKFNLSDFIGFCKNLDLQGFGKRLKEVRDRFDLMVEKIIEDHKLARKMKKEGGGDSIKDILDILLDIAEDESSEFKLTTENIKAFILDIFAAGTEASATTTEWALAELINNPSILNKARDEIDSAVGKTRLVEESDIPNLHYIQAIVKETLRLHASPLNVRESTESCTIDGYTIPARTRVFINVWAIGRDPNHWESPLQFLPERFVGGNSLDVRGQHYHYIPFGSGRRSCPGTTLALHVIQTTLAAMIQCFDWTTDGPVNMEEGPGLTLPRAKPLLCVPVVRLNPFPSF